MKPPTTATAIGVAPGRRIGGGAGAVVIGYSCAPRKCQTLRMPSTRNESHDLSSSCLRSTSESRSLRMCQPDSTTACLTTSGAHQSPAQNARPTGSLGASRAPAASSRCFACATLSKTPIA
eukprot:3060270-Prymnesium_polylepis.1